METFTNAQTALTLAHVDDECDYNQLNLLIENARYASGICQSIELIDDNHHRGYRALEYRAQIYCGTIRGTGSRWEAEAQTEPVDVFFKVRPDMKLTDIVRDLMDEIKGYLD